jgi:hypothetical protein
MKAYLLLVVFLLGGTGGCSRPESAGADASTRGGAAVDRAPQVDTVNVMSEWPHADGSLIARAVRYEGVVWATAVGIWRTGTPVTEPPLVAWGPEDGTDVLFETVAFEDLTGDGRPDLVLLGFTEDDLAYPILAAWTPARPTLSMLPIGPPGIGLPSATARDAIAVIRGADGAACAVVVRQTDSADQAPHVYRWVDGELRESPTDGCATPRLEDVTSDSSADQYPGRYVFGAEVHIFAPCARTGQYWVVGAEADSLRRAYVDWWSAAGAEPYAPMFAVLGGRFATNADVDGFAADYDGLFEVDTIVALRPLQPTDC